VNNLYEPSDIVTLMVCRNRAYNAIVDEHTPVIAVNGVNVLQA